MSVNLTTTASIPTSTIEILVNVTATATAEVIESATEAVSIFSFIDNYTLILICAFLIGLILIGFSIFIAICVCKRCCVQNSNPKIVITNPIYDVHDRDSTNQYTKLDLQLEPLLGNSENGTLTKGVGEPLIRNIDTDSDSDSHKTLTDGDSPQSRVSIKREPSHDQIRIEVEIEPFDKNATLKYVPESPKPSIAPIVVTSTIAADQTSLDSTPTNNSKSLSSLHIANGGGGGPATPDSLGTQRKYNRVSAIEERLKRKSIMLDEQARKDEKKRLSSVSNAIPIDFSFVDNSINYALETELNAQKLGNDEDNESNHQSTSDIYRKYIEERRTERNQSKGELQKSSTSLYSTRTEESEKSCY